jgi:hypothetical protein
VWTVEARLLRDREGELLSAKCNGEQDPITYPAVMLVHQYLDLVASSMDAAAYKLFSPKYQNVHPFPEFIKELRRLDLSNYKRIASPYCLDIVGKVSQASVRIRAASDCYIRIAGAAVDSLLFEIESQQSSDFKIVSIEIIPIVPVLPKRKN